MNLSNQKHFDLMLHQFRSNEFVILNCVCVCFSWFPIWHWLSNGIWRLVQFPVCFNNVESFVPKVTYRIFSIRSKLGMFWLKLPKRLSLFISMAFTKVHLLELLANNPNYYCFNFYWGYMQLHSTQSQPHTHTHIHTTQQFSLWLAYFDSILLHWITSHKM